MVKDLSVLANVNGILAAVAIDQRSSLKKYLASSLGENPSQEMMEDFKVVVTQGLGDFPSAFLLDPEYGIPAAKVVLPQSGLLLAYEVSPTRKREVDIDGRVQVEQVTDLIPGWTVGNAKDVGADGVKLLAYFNPDASSGAVDYQKAVIERVGAECAHHKMPFFLELLTYGLNGSDAEKTVEAARAKPDLVLRSMREFSNPAYGVDVLKVEALFNPQMIPDTRSYSGARAYRLSEISDLLARQNEAANGMPFILLTAGVPTDVFIETLELYAANGSKFSGELAGRAIWSEVVPVYARQGRGAALEWIAGRGVDNFKRTETILQGSATPWFERPAAARYNKS